jgi:hypothetical protein
MDLAVRSALAVVRASPAAATPPAEAETLRSARTGSLASALQVAALMAPDKVPHDRRHRSDEEQDKVAPLRPIQPLPEPLSEPPRDGQGNRYRYKVAYAPDLERPLLQIVDEKTDQIMVSLPPEQLVRMLEDAKALVEDGVQDPHARHLDTTA